jgi:hypothetical protein
MDDREALRSVIEHLERGKAALVSSVPTARNEGTPLVEALHAFESALGQARAGMNGWRSAQTEDIWRAAASGLREAARRAERLRLEAPSLDYEGLVMTLGDLMAPLEAFAEAARRLR